jgi:hypothetical protein
MAVVQTLLTNGKSGGVTSVNTASITPSEKKLILAVVMSDNNSGGNTNPTMSGNNLTWVQVITKQNATNTNQRISLFRAMGDGPATGAATIDWAGQTQTSIFWGIIEFSPVNNSGSNGAGAVVQSTSKDENTTDPMSMTLTLSTFGSNDNATFAAMIGPDNITDPAGFTRIFGDSQDLGPDNNVAAVFKASPNTSTTFTSTGGGAGVSTGVACEINFGLPNQDDVAYFM